MKQGNTNSRVDRGWEKMEVILDKEFPPKKERKLLYWLLGGLSVLGAVIVMSTLVMKTEETPFLIPSDQASLNETNKRIDNQNSKNSAILNEMEAKGNQSDTDNFYENGNENENGNGNGNGNGNYDTNSRLEKVEEKTNTLHSPTPKIESDQNSIVGTKNRTRKPRTNQKIYTQTLATNNTLVNRTSNTSTTSNQKSATNKQVANQKLSAPMLLPIRSLDQIEIQFNAEKPESPSIVQLRKPRTLQISPVLSSGLTYTLNDKRIGGEVLGGLGFRRNRLSFNAMLGFGYLTKQKQYTSDETVSSQDPIITTAGGLPEDQTSDENGAVEFDIDDRDSLGTISPSSNHIVTDRLYGLAQLGITYEFSRFSMSGFIGTEYRKTARHSNNFDSTPNGLNIQSQLGSHYGFDPFLSTQIGYRIKDNLNLGIGYRRTQFSTSNPTNRLLINVGIRF